MHNLFIYLFIYILISTFNLYVNSLNVKLSTQLQNSGFHKNLQYVLLFQKAPEQTCDFMLQQLLPADTYISTDQLNDLMRLDKIDYYVDKYIDIEALARNSNEFNISLYGYITTSFVINLPLHFRYQLPGNKNFINVNISNPKLYINCTNNNIWNTDTNRNIFKCKNTLANCEWLDIYYETNSLPISTNIPTGNLQLINIVTIFTIAVSWVGCYFIVINIYKKDVFRKRIKRSAIKKNK